MQALLSDTDIVDRNNSVDTKTKNSLDAVYLRIAPDQYHFLKFILEGYDNLAILSCINQREGLVVVRFPKGRSHEIFGLLTSIAKRLKRNI